MNNCGLKARSTEKRSITAVCYLRVGSATQLSLEEQQKYFNLKKVWKGEET